MLRARAHRPASSASTKLPLTAADKSRRFYLLRFKQACNQRPHGCGAGDLFTPQIEQDWLQIELLDAEDLQNTPQDCKLCHQRARETPLLLMREIAAPWMHFFEPVSQEPGLRSKVTIIRAYRLE